MKLHTQLQILLIASLAAMVAVGGTLLIRRQMIIPVLVNVKRMHLIIQETAALKSVMLDYKLRASERATQQWQQLDQRLVTHLATLHFATIAEQRRMDNIQQNYQRIQALFAELQRAPHSGIRRSGTFTVDHFSTADHHAEFPIARTGRDAPDTHPRPQRSRHRRDRRHLGRGRGGHHLARVSQPQHGPEHAG
jgi:hypothetical protein